jgi:hypothetical protein
MWPVAHAGRPRAVGQVRTGPTPREDDEGARHLTVPGPFALMDLVVLGRQAKIT